jgi:hypothetical protein
MNALRWLIYALVGGLVRVGRRLEPPRYVIPPSAPAESPISAEIKQFYRKELLKNRDMTPLFQAMRDIDRELVGYNNFGPKIEWRRWQPPVHDDAPTAGVPLTPLQYGDYYGGGANLDPTPYADPGAMLDERNKGAK